MLHDVLKDDALFERVFRSIREATDVGVAVEQLRRGYGLGHVTYHHAQTVTGKLNVDAPFVRTTYPDAWIARYLTKGYISVDPILREGLLRSLPFEWWEVDYNRDSDEVMSDFRSFGFSVHGYSIPIIDKVRRRALLSLNARSGDADWAEKVSRYKQDWAELAGLMHKKAIAELYGAQDPVPQLSPREIETLFWISEGKDYKDIAIIVGISELTVRSYMRSLRYKLNCSNLSQAVAKAIRLRLISG